MSDSLHLARGVIITGFDGEALDDRLAHTLGAAGFAGCVLFARNVGSLARVRALTDSLRALYDVPPLLAVDQEGGRVARLRDGIEELPPMMAIGATGDDDLARRAGEQTAFDLRRAGFNVDFAPVLDLAVDPMNTVIGTRAFGSDPVLVTRLGTAFADGLTRGGIVPTFKHFPGHGSTAVDSHLALPTVRLEREVLLGRDLVPFVTVAPDAPAMMTAHVVAEAYDDGAPATLSRKILTDLLRDRLRFSGVCFTDCMQMDAIAKGVGTVEAVAQAIAAGADCALVSHDPELALRAAEHLADQVERGIIPHDRLRTAYDRVMHLRTTSAGPIPLDDTAPHPGIGREIGRRAVTLVRGVPRADATASIVVSFESATTEGAQGLHARHASLPSQAPALESVSIPLVPTETDVKQALEAIAASQRRAIVLARRAHIYPAQAAAIDEIVARAPDALVVSVREPFDIPCLGRARHLLATYGDDLPSIAGLADVIFGSGAAYGELPVATASHA